MQNIRIFTARMLCIGLVWFGATGAYAQTNLSDPIFNYYSDTELYQNGYRAYQENNFTGAALYLYAYAQRHPEILDGPGSQEKAEFYHALVYTTRHLHAVTHQKTGDPYGREYLPLDKSYFDKKPPLPQSISLQGEAGEAQNKNVKFSVFVKQQTGDKPLGSEAVVVRYDARLHASGKAFEVTGIHTEFTGNGGLLPAVFTFKPGEMAYFEVYGSLADVKNVSKEKMAQKWTAPPLKNFGQDSIRLCKTNNFDINSQQANACYTSLSLPYSKSNTEIEPEKDVPHPVALFTTDRRACFPPCTITCTNQSQNADHFIWMVNNKVVSREKDLLFTLKKVEGYRITLIAKKGDQSDTMEIMVRGIGE